MFAHSLNIKQFYLTHRWYPVRYYHSGPKWTWRQQQWRCTPYSTKVQAWSLTIRLFRVMSGTLGGRSYPSAEIHSVYYTAPTDWVGSELRTMFSIPVWFISTRRRPFYPHEYRCEVSYKKWFSSMVFGAFYSYCQEVFLFCWIHSTGREQQFKITER